MFKNKSRTLKKEEERIREHCGYRLYRKRLLTFALYLSITSFSSIFHQSISNGTSIEWNVFVARARTLTSSEHFLTDLEHLGGFKIPGSAVPRGTDFQDRNKGRFPCPRCTSIFNRKNNLYSHLKFECGQLPRFGCPYCDYASKKSSNIRAHVRRKHYGYNVSVVNVSRDKTFEATMEDEEDRNLGQTF